jgi:hypothetical protein
VLARVGVTALPHTVPAATTRGPRLDHPHEAGCFTVRPPAPTIVTVAAASLASITAISRYGSVCPMLAAQDFEAPEVTRGHAHAPAAHDTREHGVAVVAVVLSPN